MASRPTRALGGIPLSIVSFLGVLLFGLAARADRLYVSYAGTSGHSVHVFSTDGQDLGTFARTGQAYSDAIKFDPAGNLDVGFDDVNNNYTGVRRFSPTGANLGVFVNTGNKPVEDMAFDSAGNLYVSWDYIGGNVHRYSPTGADRGVFGSPQLHNPAGLAFDAAGNLYVAVYADNTVREFSPTGSDLGVFASAGLNEPLGLVFDRGGNLYVSNAGGTEAIHKFGPAGQDLGVFATTRGTPDAMAFASNGDMYVSYIDFDEIHRFSAGGSDLGTFALTGKDTAPASLAFAPMSKPADFNGDGMVNFADLLVLAQHYGVKSGATLQTGDANGDGAVDFRDLLLLSQEFQQASGQAATSVVPEPACIAALVLPLMLIQRRRTNSNGHC